MSRLFEVETKTSLSILSGLQRYRVLSAVSVCISTLTFSPCSCVAMLHSLVMFPLSFASLHSLADSCQGVLAFLLLRSAVIHAVVPPCCLVVVVACRHAKLPRGEERRSATFCLTSKCLQSHKPHASLIFNATIHYYHIAFEAHPRFEKAIVDSAATFLT